MKTITWIASYPKSGNTWFRALLTNLLFEKDAPANINGLLASKDASSKKLFETFSDYEISEMIDSELQELRPSIYESLAKTYRDGVFVKIHDAFSPLLISSEITRSVIYLVRNPLDISVSFSHHMDWSVDKVIETMSDSNFRLDLREEGYSGKVSQSLLSWSEHVMSWVNAPNLNVHIVKYEDLLNDPITTFSKAIDFLEFKHNSHQIEQAISFSHIDILRQQEEQEGFKIKNPASKLFFRSGKENIWIEELSKDQVLRIRQDHKKVMDLFGY